MAEEYDSDGHCVEFEWDDYDEGYGDGSDGYFDEFEFGSGSDDCIGLYDSVGSFVDADNSDAGDAEDSETVSGDEEDYDSEEFNEEEYNSDDYDGNATVDFGGSGELYDDTDEYESESDFCSCNNANPGVADAAKGQGQPWYSSYGYSDQSKSTASATASQQRRSPSSMQTIYPDGGEAFKTQLRNSSDGFSKQYKSNATAPQGGQSSWLTVHPRAGGTQPRNYPSGYTNKPRFNATAPHQGQSSSSRQTVYSGLQKLLETPAQPRHYSSNNYKSTATAPQQGQSGAPRAFNTAPRYYSYGESKSTAIAPQQGQSSSSRQAMNRGDPGAVGTQPWYHSPGYSNQSRSTAIAPQQRRRSLNYFNQSRSTAIAVVQRGQSSTSWQTTYRNNVKGKGTSSYTGAAVNESTSTRNVFKERGSGGTGYKEEHKTTTTYKVGDKTGSSEYQLEERFHRIQI